MCPEESSEFRDFHWKPAQLCWSSARLLGLNFLCCGWNTTRAFIVRDQLTSSKETAVVLSTWNRSTAPQPQQKLMTFKWARSNGLLFGPAWLADVTGSEWYPYGGSPLQSNSMSIFPLMSSGAGDGDLAQTQSHSFGPHAHIYCMCTYSNRASLQILQAWVDVSQHHQMLEMIRFWWGKTLTTNSLQQLFFSNLACSLPQTD